MMSMASSRPATRYQQLVARSWASIGPRGTDPAPVVNVDRSRRLSGWLSVAEPGPDLKARSSQHDRRVDHAGSAVLQRQIASEAAASARHDENRRFFDRRRSSSTKRLAVVHAEMIGRMLGAAIRQIPQPRPERPRKELWVGDP